MLSWRLAASSTASAPAAARCARRFGHASRGRTRRSRERPKFAIARAAVPMFSASCGSTRTMIGPGSAAHGLVWSVPAPGMGSWACGAGRGGATPPACLAHRDMKLQPHRRGHSMRADLDQSSRQATAGGGRLPADGAGAGRGRGRGRRGAALFASRRGHALVASRTGRFAAASWSCPRPCGPCRDFVVGRFRSAFRRHCNLRLRRIVQRWVPRQHRRAPPIGTMRRGRGRTRIVHSGSGTAGRGHCRSLFTRQILRLCSMLRLRQIL